MVAMGNLKMVRSIFLRHKRALLMVFTLVSLGYLMLPVLKSNSKTQQWLVDPHYRELAHRHARSVLTQKCRAGFARRAMESQLNCSSHVTNHFLWRDTPLTEQMFHYPPPFGFRNMRDRLMGVLDLLPSPETQEHHRNACRRCVVVGNGGVLHGLSLGSLIDEFDVIIRLNSGPVRGFSRDVGNRTSIRMSYPEGSPKCWEDQDPQLIFVAVVFKSVDFSWLRAMITKKQVSFWDWLFFWREVPDQIPLEVSQFRMLNPEVIRETALDLLQLPTPKPHIWGWDKNVPTLGLSALSLASYLCDEVSLAGFGYDLTQKEKPLHYYDDLPMTAMLMQSTHNVNRETDVLKRLVKAGVISDLTGAIHCAFCPS